MKKISLFVAAACAIFSFCGASWAAQIMIDGSTTVLPFAQLCAEVYTREHRDVKFSVSGTGTGNGFKSLANGSAQIINASRFIKEKELGLCREKNVYPVPFAVALDCIVAVVNPANTVKTLTKDQLRDIYSGKTRSWKEVGGADAPIVAIGRDTSSGTYGTWQEMVMDRGGRTRVSPRTLVMSSSGALMTAVSQNKNAIGYDGIGYVSRHVKALDVEGVHPAPETARNGKYTLSRYLYMFTDGWPQGDVRNFINFVLSASGQRIVSSTGFIKLN